MLLELEQKISFLNRHQVEIKFDRFLIEIQDSGNTKSGEYNAGLRV